MQQWQGTEFATLWRENEKGGQEPVQLLHFDWPLDINHYKPVKNKSKSCKNTTKNIFRWQCYGTYNSSIFIVLKLSVSNVVTLQDLAHDTTQKITLKLMEKFAQITYDELEQKKNDAKIYKAEETEIPHVLRPTILTWGIPAARQSLVHL